MRYTSELRALTALFFLVLVCLIGCDSIRPIESVRDTASRVGESGSGSVVATGTMNWMGPDRAGGARFLRAPHLEELELPDYSGANSIWGSTGRDSRGRLYFGVSAFGVDDPSAALWRLDPSTNSFETLGLVNDQLDRLQVRRKIEWPETQMKIHSKIYQGADGRIYFSSQDEHEEAEDGSRNALFGGRLFAVDLNSNKWESIHASPEGLIALAARGRYVVAQGYFGHVLYQYDTLSKKLKSAKLGTYKGHVSRNIFMDFRGHVYGIRVRLADSSEFEGVYEIDNDRIRVSLVELDTELQEQHDWPLSDYAPTGGTDSHGITAFSELTDGSIVFVTHSGALWRVRHVDGEGNLERLGWMNPMGSAYCATLFSPYGDRFVCGFTLRHEKPYEWSVFDLHYNQSVNLKLGLKSVELLNKQGRLLYGCDTLDDSFRAYIVGWKPVERGNAPHIIRLTWE